MFVREEGKSPDRQLSPEVQVKVRKDVDLQLTNLEVGLEAAIPLKSA